MKSNIFKTMAVVVTAIFAGYNVYLAQAGNNNAMSDTLLANVEALASGEGGEAVITCSRSCGDGIGQCWNTIKNNSPYCEFTGIQIHFCVCNPT